MEKEYDRNELGANLKYHRLNLKLSQEELARNVGVSQQAISRWESNNSVPNVMDCLSLARFYGITLDELVGREFSVVTDE